MCVYGCELILMWAMWPMGLLYFFYLLVGVKTPVVDLSIDWEDVFAKYDVVRCNGHFKPSSCQARQKVALIVPFRDRYGHLKVFLNHIHPFLMRQQLDYKIYLIDLVSNMKSRL